MFHHQWKLCGKWKQKIKHTNVMIRAYVRWPRQLAKLLSTPTCHHQRDTHISHTISQKAKSMTDQRHTA